MAALERVMIYATGPDSQMREVGFELLAGKLASKVDRVDVGYLVVDEKGRNKLRSVGIALVIVTERAHVPTIFDRIRRVENTSAHAVPVLDVM